MGQIEYSHYRATAKMGKSHFVTVRYPQDMEAESSHLLQNQESFRLPEAAKPVLIEESMKGKGTGVVDLYELLAVTDNIESIRGMLRRCLNGGTDLSDYDGIIANMQKCSFAISFLLAIEFSQDWEVWYRLVENADVQIRLTEIRDALEEGVKNIGQFLKAHTKPGGGGIVVKDAEE